MLQTTFPMKQCVLIKDIPLGLTTTSRFSDISYSTVSTKPAEKIN